MSSEESTNRVWQYVIGGGISAAFAAAGIYVFDDIGAGGVSPPVPADTYQLGEIVPALVIVMVMVVAATLVVDYIGERYGDVVVKR
jgi:hypothetical protein